jgi:hypothetical protein
MPGGKKFFTTHAIIPPLPHTTQHMTDQNRESTIANDATTAKRTKKNTVAADTAISKVAKPKAATKQVLQDRNNILEDEVSRLRSRWHVGAAALVDEN